MKTHTSELASAMRICAGRLPVVPLFVPLERQAAWSGKWSANIGCDAVRSLGGPWNTRDEVVAAILATGNYRLRPNMPANNPHLDAIA